MGSEAEVMTSPAFLLLVLYNILPLDAQTTQAICCNTKIVTGSPGNTLDGTYSYLKDWDPKDPNCADGCIYSREGRAGEEYCFQAVAVGATIKDECDAPTGSMLSMTTQSSAAGKTTGAAGGVTTAAGGTTGAADGTTGGAGGSTGVAGGTTGAAGGTTGAAVGTTAAAGPMTTESSAALRQQALDAANRVADNQALIAENDDKIKKAEETTSAIEAIQAKLSAGATTPTSGRRREKRQATEPTATLFPVTEPTTCTAFSVTYKALLVLATAVADDNIAQIKVYVIALQVVDIVQVCNSADGATLALETNDKAVEATTSTKIYTGKKNTDNEDLKEEVNKDIVKQKAINEKLIIRDEATVPVAASTYAIQPATDSVQLTTNAIQPTPKGSTPGGGSPPPKGSTAGGDSPPPQGSTPGGGSPPPKGSTAGGVSPPPQGSTPGGDSPDAGTTGAGGNTGV